MHHSMPPPPAPLLSRLLTPFQVPSPSVLTLPCTIPHAVPRLLPTHRPRLCRSVLGDHRWVLPHLQDDAEADERHHQRVELVLLADLQHVTQLGRVRRQQRHVQHPLRDRLLGGIPVRVELLLLGERETG